MFLNNSDNPFHSKLTSGVVLHMMSILKDCAHTKTKKLNKRPASASKQLTDNKIVYTKGFLKIKQEIIFCLKTINRH